MFLWLNGEVVCGHKVISRSWFEGDGRLLKCPNGFLRAICLKRNSCFISVLPVGMNVALLSAEKYFYSGLFGVDN